MKVLLSWLREFAPFDGDPVALGDTMSGLGMAVEDLVHVGANLDGIVVARVLDVRPHPSADRIQLVDVDAGDGEALQICCGAFNMAVGDLVPLATLGTTMADGRTIERRKLRGQWSNGMLCSARELEMSDDADGIMILDSRFRAGYGARRRARRRARCALRPRPHRQPSRRAVGRGRGPRSRGQARPAVRDP